MAHAAQAWTCPMDYNDTTFIITLTSGLGDFSNDHKRRTPSCLSMILIIGSIIKCILDHTPYVMLSLSNAQAPTALVVLINRDWFVPVSN